MRTMTFCLAAILLALFDSGPAQAAPSKPINMTTQVQGTQGRDGVVAAGELQARCAGFFSFCVAPREILIVASPPPVPICAPVVYVYAEPSCGFRATNSYMIRERPYLAPIVYRSCAPAIYRQRFMLSYR